MNRVRPLLLLLTLSGCAGSAALGPGIASKEQLLQEILGAPTAVCTTLIQQEMASLALIKQSMSSPAPALFR
jgi:hypothetical protein